jgi:hypothetical protein
LKRTKKKSFLAKSLAIGCIIGAILWLVTITNERKRVPPVTVNLPDPTPTNQSQVQAPPTLGVIIRENTPVYLHNSSWQKPVTYLKAHDSVVLITPYKVLDRLGIVTERCDFVDRTTRKPSGSLREGDLVEITGTMESAGLYSIDSHYIGPSSK